jgi:nitronate monooxygenase
MIHPHRSVLRTPLCDLLGCDLPIVLAGMGGVSRWELAAAIARTGGYPTLGMVREAPDLIAAEVTALRAATDRPFAVSLIPAATDPDLLEAQIDRCLALGVGTFSFFWDVVPEAVERVKAAGCLVLHQVGTLQAALDPRPFAIGIGLSAARLPTIYPQPHDIPLDVILTDAGVKYNGEPS